MGQGVKSGIDKRPTEEIAADILRWITDARAAGVREPTLEESTKRFGYWQTMVALWWLRNRGKL